MRVTVLISLILLLFSHYAQSDEALHSAMLEQRLAAFNKKDINTLVSFYHEDVEVFYFPDKLVISGIEEFHRTYSDLFSQMKCLTAEIEQRQINGKFVFDVELTKACTISENHTDLVTSSPVVYEIEHGLIKTVVIYQ